MQERGAEQRALFRRWPAGVSVVVAEVDGRRAGLTVSSLVSLSLEPRLVGISIALDASLHELLRDAGEWAASMLSGDQAHLAQHFARSVPPIALWNGIEVREDDPRLLVGAVGWLTARTVDEVRTGDHTFFVGELQTLEEGPSADVARLRPPRLRVGVTDAVVFDLDGVIVDSEQVWDEVRLAYTGRRAVTTARARRAT